MTMLRRLAGAALLAAVAATPLFADSTKAALQISLQVTRSCRVVAAAEQVSVACGTRTAPLRLSQDGAPPRTFTPGTAVSTPSARVVTVEF